MGPVAGFSGRPKAGTRQGGLSKTNTRVSETQVHAGRWNAVPEMPRGVECVPGMRGVWWAGLEVVVGYWTKGAWRNGNGCMVPGIRGRPQHTRTPASSGGSSHSSLLPAGWARHRPILSLIPDLGAMRCLRPVATFARTRPLQEGPAGRPRGALVSGERRVDVARLFLPEVLRLMSAYGRSSRSSRWRRASASVWRFGVPTGR